MQTHHLITLLASDTRLGRAVWPGVVFAALGPILVTGSVFLTVLGFRPDLASAVTSPVTVWKWVLPFVLMAVGMSLALALSRPESHPQKRWRVIVILAAIAAGLFAISAGMQPPAQWIAAIKGKTLLLCVSSITGIGLTGLLGGLVVLRRGASTRPGLSGFALGLGSGGAATILYAMHCGSNEPMFFVTWYGSAILAVSLIGSILGRQLLKI